MQINSDGTMIKDQFKPCFIDYRFSNLDCDYCYDDFESKEKEMLFEYCGMFGVSEEDVELLLGFGYFADEIEEMLMDSALLEDTLYEIKKSL